MKKSLLLFSLAFIFTGVAVQAQKKPKVKKTKISQLDLSFLKGESEVNVVFIYDDMTVGGVAEAEYIQDNREKHADRGLGKDEEWEARWYSNREELFHPKFSEALNKRIEKFNLQFGHFPDAKFHLVMEVMDMDPGWYGGVMKGDANIVFKAHFVEPEVSDNPIVTIVGDVDGRTRNGLPTYEGRALIAYQAAGSLIGYQAVYRQGLK